MPGTFIISFDCEGKWGIQPGTLGNARHRLTTTALMSAYTKLLGLLTEYDAPATFAFVMAFTLRLSELDEWKPRLMETRAGDFDWLQNFADAEVKGDFDGWFCSEAFDLVRDSNMHEIACHGFRHVPLGGCATEEVVYELENAARVAARKGVTPRTFVYPKNHVGSLSLLRQSGYVGFRNANPAIGRFGRLGNLAREFAMWEAAQSPEPSASGLVSIPGGYFLNWRHGLRLTVPKSLTLRRWRSILDDAVARDGVALLWLHPENLVDSPGTLDLLGQIIRLAAELRSAKDLSIVTQDDYCAMRATN